MPRAPLARDRRSERERLAADDVPPVLSVRLARDPLRVEFAPWARNVVVDRYAFEHAVAPARLNRHAVADVDGAVHLRACAAHHSSRMGFGASLSCTGSPSGPMTPYVCHP